MIRFLLFCALILLSNAASGQMEALYGKWEVVSAPDSMASPEIVRSIQPYLGEKVVIKPKRFRHFYRKTTNPPVTLDKAVCKTPEYKMETQGQDQFYYFTGSSLQLFDRTMPDSLQVLTVVCPGEESEVGATFYVLREDLLLLSYLGLNCYLRRR